MMVVSSNQRSNHRVRAARYIELPQLSPDNPVPASKQESLDVTFEPQTKNTEVAAWPRLLQTARFPEELADAGGLVPIKAIINIEVG